ncbi:GLPGLI family protein [Christiangramia sp. SM2212]|uniref:GLPGLI family protein n=1 Tax=Christiangramia sediminicola TaxID=3073267 RepID=A0ABU1EL01_9FLAO|nr:GLPGLI family protein [Christiangramia sp. SM2212]MDR5589060.1 GLPGLI family protein [Christiangramia sp. SM2212]
MKNYLLLFLLFLTYFVHSQNFQDKAKYLAVYELTHQPDSTNKDWKKTERLRLYIGGKYSLFSSEGIVIKDSLMQNIDRSNRSMGAFARLQKQVPQTEFNYKIYKGIPSGKITYAEKIVKDTYRFAEEKNLMSWQILSESKRIAGYIVQKATTSFRGRNYTAWFTSDIPISEGPYKFNGLPGLILEIADEKKHYSFSLLEFKILNKPRSIDFEAEKFQKVSRKELRKAKENYKRDPITAVEQNGITFKFEPGQREKLHKEHLKKIEAENNPLEKI